MKPLFIVIEGIDGSGKTTQIDALQRRMMEVGMPTSHTNEPTNGKIGKVIRKVLKGKFRLDPSALAALFVADRMQHILDPEDGMKVRKENGESIISSRYYYSNYAFQGEYVSLEWLKACNAEAKRIMLPDAVFYINVDPDICFRRIMDGRDEIELYETLDKLTHTHEAFLDIFENYSEGENIYIIDGKGSVKEIHDRIWEIVFPMMSNNDITK